VGQLILLACYGFIFWLFRKDVKWRKAGSSALWIPGLWIAIQGSRPVSYWIGGGGGDSEGNPVNTVVYGILIIAAFIALSKRRFSWGMVIQRNKALFLIYFFLALSAFWSELPFTSFKRLIKDFGTVPVALVILTELDPITAFRSIFVRVSYLLFPLSIVFIKYFPSIGRQSAHSGENMFTGVTTQKNSLGEMAFVLSLVILWDFLVLRKSEKSKDRTFQMRVRIALLAMGIWLLNTCDSQTSVVCLVLGVFLFWICGVLQKLKIGKPLLIGGLTAAICLAAADKTFNLSAKLSQAVGRNPTLTGRTNIWRIVKEQNTDPLLGEGFYVFWDTEKGKNVVDALTRINSTHNGYLETYVDAGIVGDTLLGLLLLVIGARAVGRLFNGARLGRIGVTFWAMALLYNLSESSFFRLDLLWFTLLLVTIEYPQLVGYVVPTEEQPQWSYSGRPDEVRLGV
jgi:exopolysaccharide production protein ExoQ